MSTYRQLIYMVLDELRLVSDDASFTEEHVRFLLDKYRTAILQQKYNDVKKDIPESNYQTICLDLQEVPAMSGEPCEGGSYLKSVQKLPNLMSVGNPVVSPSSDYYQGVMISYVSKERMRFVGCNKYLKNIIYCSLGPDNYLYMLSSNPQFTQLESVRFTGIFENTEDAEKLSCTSDEVNCDIMERNFPMEEGYITTLIQLIVKELAGPSWKPRDDKNDANDDLATLATFLAKNSKSELQKELSK